MSITGLGAGNLTISGNKQSRIFDITSTTAQVTISGLTISGGSVSGSDPNGGGIYNAGTLTVSDCTLSSNAAGGGGGIANKGSLTVSDSTLSANSAYYGGGIDNAGTLTVSDSTLSGNSANYGGGIINEGSLTVSDSTLSGNTADKGGGVFNNLGNVTVSNGTLYGNSAASGGGIYVTGGSVTLHNTLVAGSTGGDVAGSNLASASDYNLIGDGSGGLNTANHNILGTTANPIDPLLSPLGNYGGPTQTLALLPGSQAIGAGSVRYGGSTDQRGVTRFLYSDIGAFESQGFDIAITIGNLQGTPINTAFTDPPAVTVTAFDPAEPVAGGQITFTAPSSGASAALSPAKPVTISASGAASVTANANGTPGTYLVTANAAGATNPIMFGLTNQQLVPKLSISDGGGT
jgi:hypothetical protein